MTEISIFDLDEAHSLFSHLPPKTIQFAEILEGGKQVLNDFNKNLGLALSEDEIDYLFNYFISIKRNPTDAELMMFAQANSEHCRHKIFNADWVIDGKAESKSLFGMIKNTHQLHPGNTIVAYSDNSSIVEGAEINRFYPNQNGVYEDHQLRLVQGVRFEMRAQQEEVQNLKQVLQDFQFLIYTSLDLFSPGKKIFMVHLRAYHQHFKL